MGNFANTFRNKANWITTENGAPVKSTTGSSLLNLFARIGGMRNADEKEIVRMWLDARNENEELADNLVLYSRSIRSGGIGERRIGRILLRELAKLNPEKVVRNFSTIVETGRWDDLYCFEGTPVWSAVLSYIEKQFRADIIGMKAGEPISLLVKWLPSPTTSSKETRRLAKVLYKEFGLTERQYRKTLSAMRKYLDIVEKKMSARQFNQINYETVPSVAMNRYRNAFRRQDEERFEEYLASVSKGEKEINSGVLFPYDVVRPYVRQCNDYGWGNDKCEYDAVLEEQWKALPNYVDGEHDVVCLCDVSGSMCELNYNPLAISTSLAIYFAERNSGSYKNLTMSFTDVPTLYELNPNDSLATRVEQVNSHVGYNTRLNGAFEAIYEMAMECGDVPEALVVISDGEIDNFIRYNHADSIITAWVEKFNNSALDFPKVIMWNCASRGNRFLDDMNNPYLSFISGASASSFKELTTLITKDAYTAMVEILSKPEFSWK